MGDHFLYSTSVLLKLIIQERFRHDLHYAWCSEHFDSKKLSRYSSGAMIAPSSNPADIYREIKRDVEGKDTHSSKINGFKTSLTSLAIEWAATGEIQPAERDEILHMINTASFEHWTPLIYVIPRALVEPRLELVPPDKRAGFGVEYIIKDLKRTEFDIIEF